MGNIGSHVNITSERQRYQAKSEAPANTRLFSESPSGVDSFAPGSLPATGKVMVDSRSFRRKRCFQDRSGLLDGRAVLDSCRETLRDLLVSPKNHNLADCYGWGRLGPGSPMLCNHQPHSSSSGGRRMNIPRPGIIASLACRIFACVNACWCFSR
jgi:hypothetical protein